MHRPLLASIAAILVVSVLAGCSNLDVLTIKSGAPSSETPTAASLPPLPSPPEPPRTRTYAERVDALVMRRSADLGLEMEAAEWRSLSQFICDDLAKGGPGLWTTPSAASLPDESQRKLADLNQDGAVLSMCPTTPASADWKRRHPSSPLADQLVSSAITELYLAKAEYSERVRRYNDELIAYGRLHRVDTRAFMISLGGSGAGSSVVCLDGWVSQGGGKKGACSHHGGVR